MSNLTVGSDIPFSRPEIHAVWCPVRSMVPSCLCKMDRLRFSDGLTQEQLQEMADRYWATRPWRERFGHRVRRLYVWARDRWRTFKREGPIWPG